MIDALKKDLRACTTELARDTSYVNEKISAFMLRIKEIIEIE